MQASQTEPQDEEDNEVDCPICGMSINKHGLGSHKNSQRCEVQQDRNEIQERNLTPVPNSQKIKDFLKQSEYEIETKMYQYNGQRSHQYNNMETTRARKYTSKEGLKEAERQIYPNASEKGIRIEVSERLDGGVWLCTLGSENYYESELIFVDVDTDEDVSRRRVSYVNPTNNIAFTTDGDRIGDIYLPEEAEEELGVNSHEIISRIV